MTKIICDKLAIFDLDGTLYKGNSHIEYLSLRYRTMLFKTYIWKLFSWMFPALSMKIIWYLYKNKKDKAHEFLLPFRKETMEIFDEYKREGWTIAIVSNAPSELLIKPAYILQVNAYRANQNEKLAFVKKKFDYKKLFVCTDNTSDIDLVNGADSARVFYTNRSRRIFESKVANGNVEYYSIEDLEN